MALKTPAELYEIRKKVGKLGGRPKKFDTIISEEKKEIQKAVDDKKKVAFAKIEELVINANDSIVKSQISNAVGLSFLYKIKKEFRETGKNKKTGEKNGYWIALKPELVTSQFEIENYLNNVVDKSNGKVEDENNPADTYYFITTKEPNNQAADSLLNRVHGRAKESIEISGEVKLSLGELSRRALEKRKIIDAEVKTVDVPLIENNQEGLNRI